MTGKLHKFQSLGIRASAIDPRCARVYAGLMPDAAIEKSHTELRSALVKRRQAIAEEIACHPRPITACDVHFNRLLEERAALSEQIDRLDDLIGGS